MSGSLPTRRALVLIHTPTFGGPHNTLVRLREPLERRGWENVLVTTNEAGDGAERVRAAGVETLQVPLRRLRKSFDPRVHWGFVSEFVPSVDCIRALIRRHGASVVQVCGLMHPHGALAARLEQTPVVWQLLSTFAPPVLRRVLMPVVVKLADVVMSTGRDTAREHPGACAMGERLVPFFPPVDTDQFRPDPVARLLARAELRVPPGALLVGTVGNMVWQKGHELLVDAVAELRGRHHPVYGRVLGSHVASQDRYYRENVIGRARKRGLLRSEVLTFSSPGDRVSQLLPAFDVFLLTSRAEGAPTVVLEAMACAVPVVATDVGSMREIVEDGRTGFVVRRGRVEPLVSAIEKLLRSPATRDAMGTVARRRAVERYGLGACADAHVRAFELAASVRRIAGTEPATDIGAAESC